MKREVEKTLTISHGSAVWIAELKMRYRAMQIWAAVAINSALREFGRISVA